MLKLRSILPALISVRQSTYSRNESHGAGLSEIRQQTGFGYQTSDAFIILNGYSLSGSGSDLRPLLRAHQQARLTDIIAASSVGKDARSAGSQLFTNSVIAELRSMASFPSFSVAGLFEKILLRVAQNSSNIQQPPMLKYIPMPRTLAHQNRASTLCRSSSVRVTLMMILQV